jgi:membrane protein YqaA with SNARE-associated domain
VTPEELKSRKRYIFENIARSFFYIAVLLGLYVLLKSYIVTGLEQWIEYASERKTLMFGLFFISELAFGLVPPEVFFVVFPKEEYSFFSFSCIMVLMSIMSYMAGSIIFLVGRFLGRRGNFRLFDNRWYLQYKEKMEVYGNVLLVLACTTPIPYATVALVAGSQEYPFPRFLIISITRLLRFVIYGAVVYYVVG